MSYSYKTPHEVRLAFREKRLDASAPRVLPGYLCLNLVCLDVDYADEFAAFCAANPKPCPVYRRFEPGQTCCDEIAVDLDIRTDLRAYDVIRHGEVEQRTDIIELFNKRSVKFLIGSSTSFDGLLPARGLHPTFFGTVQQTRVPCKPAGRFKGDMVVTIRAFEPSIADAVWEFTSHFPQTHGAPVGKNNWRELGIPERDVDWRGEPFHVPEGSDRLYWGCGATPRFVAQQSNVPFFITHSIGGQKGSGSMITDIPTESLYTEKTS